MPMAADDAGSATSRITSIADGWNLGVAANGKAQIGASVED